MKCQHCKEEVEVALEWHKNGRQGTCPACNKKIYFTRNSLDHKRDENGSLRRMK